GEPAAREEAHLAREAAGHQLGERKAAREEVARAGDLEGEEAAEVVVGRASRQRGAAFGEAIQVLLRDVDAAARQVAGHVLPEVGELERGADVVRARLARRGAVAGGSALDLRGTGGRTMSVHSLFGQVHVE